MFHKHGFRPAFAGVTPTDKLSRSGSRNSDKFEGVAFSSSETDDFNSFSSKRAPRTQKKTQQSQKKPQKKTVTLEISGKTLFKFAAIIVAVILLLVLGITLIISSSKPKDILYEDNAFASYQAIDGTFKVSMNGKVLKDVFESDVELTPAKDNSFAYVCATVKGAKNVYLLDGGKLDLLCEGIDSVLRYSDLVPGVIYSKGNRVEYFFDEATTSFARNGESTPENFVISPDGTAVAFTIKNKNDNTVDDLYVYTIDQASPLAKSNGVSTIPVAISNGGEHVLANLTDGEASAVYHLVDGTRYRVNELTGAFNAVTATNAEGDEIIFTTKTETEYHSYIYDFEEYDEEANTATYLDMGYCVPQFTDPEVAYKATFKKSYFQNITTELTFYLNKKYEKTSIASYLGQFSPNMKYFYFINKQREVLVRLDLDSGDAKSISTGATDFVITNKGNIYYTDGYGDLNYLKVTEERPIRISTDVTKLSFYDSANELYFEKAVSAETTEVYSTAEGSDPERVKFGKTELVHLPEFTNEYSKKTYAYAYDDEKGNHQLFYHSVGSSFKLVAECKEITTDYRTDIEKQIEEVLS